MTGTSNCPYGAMWTNPEGSLTSLDSAKWYICGLMVSFIIDNLMESNPIAMQNIYAFNQSRGKEREKKNPISSTPTKPCGHFMPGRKLGLSGPFDVSMDDGNLEKH